MPKGKSGIKRGGSVGGKGGKTVAEEIIHGVPQSQIDALRGTREQMKPSEQTWEVVKDDYARVGIQVTDEYAQQVHNAVRWFTGSGYAYMRKALALERAGRPLMSAEKDALAAYKLCMEYCRIAPTIKLKAGEEVMRGVYGGNNTYAQKIFSLKVGEKFDFDRMPTSFTSKPSVATKWVSSGGIIFHVPSSALKDSPGIRGISSFPNEFEVFFADYNFKVGKIDDQRKTGDGHYHVHFEPDV